MDVNEVTQEAVRYLPNMAERQASLGILLTVHRLYVQSTLVKMTSEAAVAELQLTRGWNKETIQTAYADVGDGLAQSWTTLADEFNSRTLESGQLLLTRVDLEAFARRFVAEQTEQDQLVAQAQALLAKTKTVAEQLRLTDPTVEIEAEVAPEETEKPKRGLKSLLRMGLVQRGMNLVFVPTAESANDLNLTPPPAGWTTPPLINTDDPDLKVFALVVTPRAGSQAKIEDIWAALRLLGYDDAKVSELLTHWSTRLDDRSSRARRS